MGSRHGTGDISGVHRLRVFDISEGRASLNDYQCRAPLQGSGDNGPLSSMALQPPVIDLQSPLPSATLEESFRESPSLAATEVEVIKGRWQHCRWPFGASRVHYKQGRDGLGTCTHTHTLL